MEEIFLAGRVLVGGYYLSSAFHHFSDLGSLAEYAGALGVPLPAVAVVVAGILLAIGGLTMILGIYPDVGIAALVLFFVPVTVIMHAFWADSDPTMRQIDLVNFGKNVALLGSSLMFAVVPRPWAYSLERRAHLPVKVPV
jgi:putative oxidoreductase